MMDFELSTCGPDRSVRVRVCGECDASNAATLRDFLLGVLTAESARMVLDLSRLDFLDCAGARSLVAVSRRARLLGGSLAVTAPTAPVARLLHVTGLGGLLLTSLAADQSGGRSWPSPRCTSARAG
jgi:anti-anti-sigma factor